MDQAFIDEMKTALEEERAELEKQLGVIATPDTGDHVPGEHNPKFPDYGDDNLGEKTASPAEVAEFEKNAQVTSTLEDRLNAVRAALVRIEDGTYGKTEDGEQIIDDRLRADPAATTNVEDAD